MSVMEQEKSEERQERQEVLVMREERPSQLYPQLESLKSTTEEPPAGKERIKKKQILTLLGGFIVCLSFGSGKKYFWSDALEF